MTGTSNRSVKLAAVVSVLVLLAGAALLAQPANAREPMVAQAATSAPTTSAQPPKGPTLDVESRITDLHKKLGITAAQEPQFKAYADVLRANAQALEKLFEERAKETDFSAPARLRWYARLTAAHAENVGKLVPVFEALYQVLSDPQKKAADTYFEALSQRRPARRTR